MSRIYNIDNGDACVENKGWMSYREFNSLSNKAFYKKIDEEINLFKLSPVYIADNMETGNEDFLPNEWNNKKLAKYWVGLRTFKSGKGSKRVADNIIDCGLWMADNKKDITEKMNILYKNEIQSGYELQVIKSKSYGN